MQKFDVIIVGGGMVGLTQALALAQNSELSIAVLDASEPEPLAEDPSLRVSAINAASQTILANLQVWPSIIKQRHQAYNQMFVWDKDGFGHLDFNSEEINREQLGWIIENSVIRHALWQKANDTSNITLLVGDSVQSLAVGDSEVFVSFQQTLPITGKMLVAADGANSWVRQQLDTTMTFRDYDHHAIVATVKCEHAHNNTAWQVFLPDGPLAFLPLYEPNLVSIVWSVPPEQANNLITLNEKAFNQQISAATDGKFGQVSLQSKRVSYPLTMRLVHDFVQPRIAFVGDAAHTIHPLAGQGVNLGLLDAAALAETLLASVAQQRDIADMAALKQFARWRKTEATEMVVAMETIKQSFAQQSSPIKAIRGLGMSLINNMPIVKRKLMQTALGNKSTLPSLATCHDPLA